MNKICKRCLDDKPIERFGDDKRNQDNKQSRCYDCCNESRRVKYSNDEEYRKKQKTRQKKYNKYANNNAKKHIKNLSDFYIIKELKRGTVLTTKDVKKHPNLIEAKRQIIKNKRLCRI
tara:strand:- start:206 stop:559 length:354 start_codon:yes stop_codon:yes gene_type:complete